MTARFGRDAEDLGPFQIAVEQFLNRWGYQFANEAEIVELIFTLLNGAARTWYVNLYKTGAPEMYSLATFFQLLEVPFRGPALVENARTDLRNLKQGTMTVKEYSAKFCTIATNLADWPDSLLVEYYRDGLSVELQCKAIDYSSPQTLVEWIQAASEMEAHSRLVKSVRQRRSSSPPSRKPTTERSGLKPCPPSDSKREQRFKAGSCLTCGGSGHFAAHCPSSHPTTSSVKPPPRPPAQKQDGARPSARSALAEALEDLQVVESANISERTLEVQPSGNDCDPP